MRGGRYDVWRRRLGRIGLLLGLGVLVWQLWARDRAVVEGTVILDLGEYSADVTQIDIDLLSGSESVGSFHQDTSSGVPMGRPQFRVQILEAEVLMVAVIRVRDTVRTIEQPVRVPDNGRVVVRLADELAPRAGN